MALFKCESCDYVYDEIKGDSWSSVPAGTKFNELPKNWVCPVCFAEQSSFRKISDEEFIKKFFNELELRKIQIAM